MSVGQAVLWLLVGPAVSVCGGVALAWSLLRVGEWRRARQAEERWRLDRRVSQQLREAAERRKA